MKTNVTSTKFKLVIANNAKPMSTNLTCRTFLDLTFDDLVREIKENRGGKYDSLYK